MAAPLRGWALMRGPADNLAEGLCEGEKQPVDLSLARAQWEAYKAVLESYGWHVLVIERARDLPDSVFIEDALFLLSDQRTLVLPVLTAPTRRAESSDLSGKIALHKEFPLHLFEMLHMRDCTMDGGDVLRVGETLYVGASARTTPQAIRELRRSNAPHPVIAVPVTKALHLKSCVTALPDGTVIGNPRLVDNPSLFPHFLPMPEDEPEGGHVVCLSEDTVLNHASAPKSAALLRKLGYKVVSVDMSEFEKLDGCVTCLSVLIPHLKE